MNPEENYNNYNYYSKKKNEYEPRGKYQEKDSSNSIQSKTIKSRNEINTKENSLYKRRNEANISYI